MTLPCVIANPSAASGSTEKAWPGIASELRSHFGPYQVKFTEKRGDALTLALESARQGVRLIIACGGDGTISEVANGILDSGLDAELGILPSGTGGDFRRTLGIPNRTRDAAQILRNGKSKLIDVGRVTFVSHNGEQTSRHFLGVASFGMSAEVVERVKHGRSDWLPKNAPRWLSGRVSFAVSMLQTAAQTSAARVIVQVDDRQERYLTVTNLCVANARYFGGGMKIAPDAKLNDGRFDVVSIGDIGKLKILTNAPRLYAGSHLSMENVDHVLARKIVARPDSKEREVLLEIDGELPGRLPATFQIVPSALRVRCPA
jgi:YegS/Rv2252/BmrU family lipid kinase